jgi:hypothetical protein
VVVQQLIRFVVELVGFLNERDVAAQKSFRRSEQLIYVTRLSWLHARIIGPASIRLNITHGR